MACICRDRTLLALVSSSLTPPWNEVLGSVLLPAGSRLRAKHRRHRGWFAHRSLAPKPWAVPRWINTFTSEAAAFRPGPRQAAKWFEKAGNSAANTGWLWVNKRSHFFQSYVLAGFTCADITKCGPKGCWGWADPALFRGTHHTHGSLSAVVFPLVLLLILLIPCCLSRGCFVLCFSHYVFMNRLFSRCPKLVLTSKYSSSRGFLRIIIHTVENQTGCILKIQQWIDNSDSSVF